MYNTSHLYPLTHDISQAMKNATSEAPFVYPPAQPTVQELLRPGRITTPATSANSWTTLQRKARKAHGMFTAVGRLVAKAVRSHLRLLNHR
jgi:hypothetical protein